MDHIDFTNLLTMKSDSIIMMHVRGDIPEDNFCILLTMLYTKKLFSPFADIGLLSIEKTDGCSRRFFHVFSLLQEPVL